MNNHEAFRISLGTLAGERSLQQDQRKIAGIRLAIERLLAPFKLAARLKFFREANVQECKDWLVIKIESSGQLPLLDQLEQEWSDDPELRRECANALEMARAALNILRELATVARMTPFQFHAILAGTDAMSNVGMRLTIAADTASRAVVIRDPQGNDTRAEVPSVCRRQTMPSSETATFLVKMVGKTCAIVQRVKDDGSFNGHRGKGVELHWGNVPHRAVLMNQFYSALGAGLVVSASVRETVNQKGKVVRFEWFGSA